MPPLIRRRPLSERIKAYLNPLDFLLWLSEELDSSAWEQWEKEWSIPLGIGLNVVFLIARANSRTSNGRIEDDVFGDVVEASFFSWFASFVVHLLAFAALFNAFYTFWRKRHYRLFEASIDNAPATPSAHRVPVNSSPMVSSPMRFLSSVLSIGSAEARAHPNAQRDVWELGVWDPHPLSLRLLCLFSPGHVFIYWLFLPTSAADPQPSVTIVMTLFLATLLTVQMSMLSSAFSQQLKDSTLVHKEVLNEYDTKYVHPRTQPVMRSVATQHSEEMSYNANFDEAYNTVNTYTPAMRRGFKISPNPNYISHIDPEGALKQYCQPPRPSTSTPRVSSSGIDFSTPPYGTDPSSPLRARSANIRQPHFRSVSSTADGGSLGVFSHARSPLRKATSTHFDQRPASRGDEPDPRDRLHSAAKRPSSPLKRSSVPGGVGISASQKFAHITNAGRGIRRDSERF
ncbi:conserved hypothetical protein [Histoplasma capsulatum G186AR]|uniref:Meiotically up-regulated gene 154 protein n=2 Tax=Ajellomyces capsulatus TaxID=5037 RepID=C0NNF0_AJECG|nr:uncharacterized protein HCBG_04277 [Histoplasma capsulatum G186AR]EEH07398.1 conserved hypothetical protein [Histoplasma capsulatum G186AR]KAG5304466.1 DUF2418 superfamily domain-containing protein [Histoplasma capsulatum]QSS70064.1 DUF2418 superfamily domain-containing protein [Histoplasma capsulatum G186AR]